jgi:hypothetical protein
MYQFYEYYNIFKDFCKNFDDLIYYKEFKLGINIMEKWGIIITNPE